MLSEHDSKRIGPGTLIKAKNLRFQYFSIPAPLVVAGETIPNRATFFQAAVLTPTLHVSAR